ncbi:MAG: DUF1272 domain-containing protein [Gemmatimonadales bacterium]
MPLELRPECERCHASLPPDGVAFICTYECTFCDQCTSAMKNIRPNCGGELVRRPRRKE